MENDMLRMLCLLLLLPGLAWAAPWRLDSETAIWVDVDWEGRTVSVQFPQLSGIIDFDADRPESAQAEISVSAQAATTGVAAVDQLVRSRDYLAAAQYPAITFRLDRLVQTSKQTADIFGRITLRGVTRPLSFKAQVRRYGPSEDDPQRFDAAFDLEGQIDRTEFGSTGGLPYVAATMPVHIRLVMSSR
jgi:polyisoprenoid-binding protein YceI